MTDLQIISNNNRAKLNRDLLSVTHSSSTLHVQLILEQQHGVGALTLCTVENQYITLESHPSVSKVPYLRIV